jgi:hypothetical protein
VIKPGQPACSTIMVQRLLRRQTVGAVRLLRQHVVWRCRVDEYAVWPERNIYSAVPPGCRYSILRAVEVLTRRR